MKFDGPDSPSNVVQLLPRATGPKSSLTIRRAPDACFPHAFVFDEKTRTIECPKCKREFLPFDALVLICRSWAYHVENLKGLASDVKELREEKETLRREVSNLRAQKRRATP